MNKLTKQLHKYKIKVTDKTGANVLTDAVIDFTIYAAVKQLTKARNNYIPNPQRGQDTVEYKYPLKFEFEEID